MLLHYVSYGARKQFDGLVRLVAPADNETSEAVTAALRRHSRHFVLVTLREVAQGDAVEHAYQVRIPDPEAKPKLMADLAALPDVRDISIHVAEPSLEV